MNLGLGDGLANVLSTVHKGGHTEHHSLSITKLHF